MNTNIDSGGAHAGDRSSMMVTFRRFRATMAICRILFSQRYVCSLVGRVKRRWLDAVCQHRAPISPVRSRGAFTDAITYAHGLGRSIRDLAGKARIAAIPYGAALSSVNFESGRQDSNPQPPAWEAEGRVECYWHELLRVHGRVCQTCATIRGTTRSTAETV